MNPDDQDDLYIEPMLDSVNRVLERYLEPTEPLTFDERLTPQDRVWLRTIGAGMGGENGTTR